MERYNQQGPQIEKDDKNNINFVFQQKWGALSYGVFHSKLILYEFDDRLRVIVTSANLYQLDWKELSQVIWFQDFYPAKQPSNQNSQVDSDFGEYLQMYIQAITPRNKKTLDVFRKSINLKNYDFSTASVSLVASVNGRHNSQYLSRYGQNRLGYLCKKTDQRIITFLSSSISKVQTKFMKQFYSQFVNKKPTEQITEQFKLIFPTSEFVESSFIGSERAESIILKKEYWQNLEGFPKDSFHILKGSNEKLDRNLFHAKVMIVTDGSHEIDDDTILYFGSHNFSAGAWGTLEKNETQIAISNWEIGVVFKAQENSQAMKQQIVNRLTFQYPPEKYENKDMPFFREDYM